MRAEVAQSQVVRCGGQPGLHRVRAVGAGMIGDGQERGQRCQSDQLRFREGDAVLTSVGGYRLEGPSIRLFETVTGDYFTILGLPILPLLAALRELAPETLL